MTDDYFSHLMSAPMTDEARFFFNSICHYHMGRKNNETIEKLDAEGHVFEREYDLYFNDCFNKRCRRSHDRATCINYFYVHPEKWFDYVVNAIAHRVPMRFIYHHFRPITTHDPTLMLTIARYSKRPCYSVIDGVRCRNPRCRLCHNKSEINMYYIYHPNVYLDDLVYKISKLDEKEDMAAIERIRPEYLSMLEQFKRHGVNPANTSAVVIKSQVDDNIVMAMLNKISSLNVMEFVEATNRYALENSEKIDSIIRTICKESASVVVRFPKMMDIYYTYVNTLHRSTVFSGKLSEFINQTIAYIDVEWNNRYVMLTGHPVDYEFPNENLVQREMANAIEYLLKYGSGQIYDHGVAKLLEIINGSNKTENMIIIPYILKFSGYVSTSVLQRLFENTSSLPASSFKSKLRFALMDALDI